MTLIAIIIALLLEMFWQGLSGWRRYGWFPSYLGVLKERFGATSWWDGPAGVLLVIFILLLPVLLLQALINDLWLGLPELLLGVAVLSLCLRFQPLDVEVDHYLEAVVSGDDERIDETAASIYSGSSQAGDEGQEIRKVTHHVLISANERLFAVLFWFVLLGPLGAVIYRTVQLLGGAGERDTEERVQEMQHSTGGFAHAATRLMHILDWAPSRLLALTYGVSGSFEDALHEWREYYDRTDQPSLELGEEILAHAGCGALHVGRYERKDARVADGEGEELEPEAESELEPEVVKSARALVLRSLLTWCIILALVTISGWVS